MAAAEFCSRLQHPASSAHAAPTPSVQHGEQPQLLCVHACVGGARTVNGAQTTVDVADGRRPWRQRMQRSQRTQQAEQARKQAVDMRAMHLAEVDQLRETRRRWKGWAQKVRRAKEGRFWRFFAVEHRWVGTEAERGERRGEPKV